MQIGSIPPTYCGSFLHTLIFPYRGSPQQVERPHSQRRNRCKLISPGQIAGLRPRQIIARLVTAIVQFVCPMAAIRAMPSARALLVASLLTEPPYGCLGPPGNDRYRKRSLRSQTVGGFASQLPKSRRLFRNESATSRRVRAGAIG